MSRRLLVLTLLWLAGCASTSAEEGQRDVSRMVEERGGRPLRFRTAGPEDAEVDQRVRALLAGELTADAAVEIALVRNQGLQATYESLGIAQAELVQAGLLKNPSFGASVRFPSGGGGLNTEFSLAQDFLDLLLLPLRRRFAGARLEETKARVSAAVLELAAQVRGEYLRHQAAEQEVQLLREIAEGEGASDDLAHRQFEAGNIAELDLANQDALLDEARLALAQAEAEVTESRERLNRLMGLWGPEAAWRVSAQLPALPGAEPALERLESAAVAHRLDLQAARHQAESLLRARSLTSGTRLFPGVGLGISTERDPEGTRVTGPTLELELPLFDQGQARVAHLDAEVREALARQAELATAVRAEVRTARARLLYARARAEYQTRVSVPRRRRILELTQLHYNGMFVGLYQLISAKQAEINARREAISALRDYWMARAELERAVGGRLSAAPEAGDHPRPAANPKEAP